MIRHPPCARGKVMLNLECAPSNTRPKQEEVQRKQGVYFAGGLQYSRLINWTHEPSRTHLSSRRKLEGLGLC